jgi:two-component system response regulator
LGFRTTQDTRTAIGSEMTARKRPITILVADDDPDDRTLTAEAFAESRLANDLRFVEDGVELLDYLHRQGKYADPASSPWPGVILLDLNMPRMDGREALREIKADPRFRGIRVVIMTTSKAEEDVVRSYDLSAASYITKPVTFEGLVEVVKVLGRYWLEIVELPPDGNGKPTPRPAGQGPPDRRRSGRLPAHPGAARGDPGRANTRPGRPGCRSSSSPAAGSTRSTRRRCGPGRPTTWRKPA